MIIEGESVVQGELMMLHPWAYTRLLADLDQLEGYQPGSESRFCRVQRQVRTESGAEVCAWLYLGDARILKQEPYVLIPHGD